MKKLIITAALILGIGVAFGQSKKPKTTSTIAAGSGLTSSNFGITDLKYTNAFDMTAGTGPTVLSIDQPKNGWNNKIDSIVIHVKKQNFRWLNDSTAVITK